MKREIREFLAQQEAVGAARSKAAKKKKRQKLNYRMTKYFHEKAARIEANGNPAGADQFRRFWARFPHYEDVFPEEKP